jgi:glycosyltransferase involved in cell wall biosynthesis
MNPKVSIITPCYNASLFINDLVLSLNEMSFSDWECILINDGSTDDTIVKLEALKSDKRFIIFTTNRIGVSNARNLGLKNANGKYIQFLDADDFLQKEKLFMHINCLENNSNFDVVFSDALYFDDNNLDNLYKQKWSLKAPVSELEGDTEFTYTKLLEGNRFVISGPLFRRNLSSIKEGFIDDLNYNEDWEFWLRLARNGARFKFVDGNDAKSLIRVHTGNSSKNLNGMFVSELMIYRSIISSEKSNSKHRNMAKKYYLFTWLEILKRMLKGDSINALQILRSLKNSKSILIQ